ncbi:hypothetical protein CMQ_4248 [Grosmannia clavigera kw1407]|uniref:DUF1308 domain-containing protein n=1 Tax=Grosmannia clavigera (strain kw1407 / UAMH 11150) TaxID=655863 RepID=F0X8P4_GROCL|nr:uncharacterized protein CMQ_4248 [Grosmannia clavigera kw1407]EFX06179.1 hypothetical protein CMQ_4248 [Grosmannia clavigera kw1407]
MAGTEQTLSNDDATAEVLARWQTLIAEHEALRDTLREYVQQPHWPGVGPCISMLKTEAATVARLLAARARLQAAGSRQDDGKVKPEISKEEEAVGAKLAASNLSAREVAWGAIKKRSGLLALDRRFPKMIAGHLNDAKPAKLRGGGVRYSGGRTEGVFVNAVVDDGREWLRILTTTESQLLMEMAENGWEFEEREEADEDQDSNANNSDLDLDHVSIVSAAIDLMQAAQANRFRGAPPRVCILLSRISEGGRTGRTADLDVLLRLFRQRVQTVGSAAGVAVTVHSASSVAFTSLPPPLEVALKRLMPAITAIGGDGLSSTLNIDTSILIALASDITHGPVTVESWHPRQRVDEITRETEKPGDVLRRLLNDVLRGRRLVCTREAALAFRNMVRGMGQQTEKARAAVLVGDEEAGNGTYGHQNSHSLGLLSTYRGLSSYPDVIPDDLHLPITVVADDWDVVRILRAVDEESLPAAAAAVVHEMTAVLPTAVPTLAVFFYGWASHHATITTNMAAKNRIERLLEQFRTSPDEDGPAVWVCRSVRSLNGTNPRSQR